MVTASDSGYRLLAAIDPRAVGAPEAAPLVLALQATRYGAGPVRCSFQAAVLEPRELPCVLVEQEIVAPGAGWEFRASGLWAEEVCEEPGRRWSYGLEAFALAVDDPRELLLRGHGHRVPLGWELDFEAVGDPTPDGPGSAWQLGVLHGLLLGANRELEIEGNALRRAWSGPRPAAASAADRCDWRGERPPGRPDQPDQQGVPLVEVALPGPDGIWWVARTPTGARCRAEPV